MDRTIFIKHLWQIDDLVQAYKYHKKSSKYFWLSRFIIFGLGIVNLLFGIISLFSGDPNMFNGFQLAIGLILIMSEIISNASYRYRCKKLNYAGRQVEWEVMKDKITHRMLNLSESTFTWELIIGVLDTPKGFLLYPQRNLFYFIPKSGFQQQEDIAHFAFLAQDRVKNWQQIK
jgi:hypothetical protein